MHASRVGVLKQMTENDRSATQGQGVETMTSV